MSSISNVHLLEALKITKCRRRSKSNLTNNDFNKVVMEDVKYLPFSDGNVLFILPSIKIVILDAYGKAMDGMDKIYNEHAWCSPKIINTKSNFGLTFWRCLCVGHPQCPNDLCEYFS